MSSRSTTAYSRAPPGSRRASTLHRVARRPRLARRPRGRSRRRRSRSRRRRTARVAGPAVGAHRDRRAAAPAFAPPRRGSPASWRRRPARASSRTSRTPCTPRVVRGGDDRADALGPQLRGWPRPCARPGRRAASAVGPRVGQAGPLLELLDGARDRGGPLDERREPSSSTRPVDATPTRRAVDEAEVDVRARARRRSGGSRCWRTASARDSPATTSASASRRAGRLGRLDDLLARGAAPPRGRRRSPCSALIAITPTRTFAEPRARHPVARRGRSAPARPCRSSACPTSASSRRRRWRPSTATART